MLILDDAEFTQENMDQLFGGVYGSTGQICMNAKRIYVHTSKKQQLIDELTRPLQMVQMGPASDPETTMGPQHQKAKLDYVAELVQTFELAEVREFGNCQLVNNRRKPYVRQ